MSRIQSLAHKAVSVGLAVLSFVARPLAGRIATYLWFTPFPFARPKEPRLPAGARRISFKRAGSAVGGYQMGDGPRTALLIHGWAGSSRQYRRLAWRLAEEGYRVAVIDLPAHGMEAGRSTDLFELAGAIETAGAQLGRIDIVVAHSLGAMATGVAMQRSLKADRLVFVAPGLSPRHAFDSFAKALRLRPTVARSVEREMEKRFGEGVWDEVPKAMLDLPVPRSTLVIHDWDDDMIPIESTELLSESWGAGLLSTRGHGHNGVLRAAEVIDRIAALAAASPASA
jgi:predicted alpha/beta hydrolase family esterase